MNTQLGRPRYLKWFFRICVVVAFVVGLGLLAYLIHHNRLVGDDVARLEAELGRMNIKDQDRIHLVAIKSPSVPPEVAPHVGRLWQFRCYLPAGYDFKRLRGGGRVAKDGVFLQGGFSQGWSSSKSEPSHELLTISVRQRGEDLLCFCHLGGSMGDSSLGKASIDRLLSGDLVVETLATDDKGVRSFDQDTILPVFKIYDPATAKDETIQGRPLTTYRGGILVIYPKSREQVFDDLRVGKMPDEFETAWIAEGFKQ